MLRQYHGLGPEDLQLMRHLVYTFECRLAQRWRVGRVFLAGDAAHTNPPYLGQGACSGMRDAANLAWKLDLVLRGTSGDALLDTYEAERRPHALSLMLQSRSLGLVANTSNPVKAAVRDLLFRFKLAPKPEFPTLVDGVLQREHGGKLVRGAGSLPGQGHLMVGGRKMRFDQHAGFSFTLLMRHVPQGGLAPALQASLRKVGVRAFAIDGPATDPAHVGDADGTYRALMDGLGADAVLLRPDFVLYGHARFDGWAALLEGLLAQLRCMPVAEPA
jgi:3-(3-hydroxy-phenyl)propionate hydroxylase